MNKIYYHLPGLFEFYDFYNEFLKLYHDHRDYFYDWCEIGSIYGAPANTIWSGGRVGLGTVSEYKVKELMNKYHLSSRLTLSNSLIEKHHLLDKDCNKLCSIFEDEYNGVIVHSDLLHQYIKDNYPKYHFISSTTKVITDFNQFVEELNKDYKYVVADFRLNHQIEKLKTLTQIQKDKVEFLCNECCYFGCNDRKACYENVSRINLGIECQEHQCLAPGGKQGYMFSKAMENPGFISVQDICDIYKPLGFSHFKIEGRGLGSALLLEFLLYYMVKPQYQIHVREYLYLDNMLDLF